MIRISLVFVLFFLSFGSSAAVARETDDQVRDRIILMSIEAYPGRCACPYHAALNGSRCGKRSAYSRPGGYAPLCFREDVTQEMVDRLRRQEAVRAGKQ